MVFLVERFTIVVVVLVTDWLLLNGISNDYSGNGNNGQISGSVTFVSNWWNGYTPP